VRQRRFEEVESYLRRIPQISNHLGLFGEQYDPRFQQITGNLPQAFSHIGYVTSILEYLNACQQNSLLQPMPVKEIPLFFERAQYRIGQNLYTLSDIEHGILRQNVVPPWRVRRRFGSGDPRLTDCVTRVDPRIHFALVCASRTCPPIEVYEADRVDAQLDTSAQVFINATTTADQLTRRLIVSEIFKWYRQDLPKSDAERIRFVAHYLYDREIAGRLEKQAPGWRLTYRPYDWRLNH
jgi:hypothetical protein